MGRVRNWAGLSSRLGCGRATGIKGTDKFFFKCDEQDDRRLGQGRGGLWRDHGGHRTQHLVIQRRQTHLARSLGPIKIMPKGMHHEMQLNAQKGEQSQTGGEGFQAAEHAGMVRQEMFQVKNQFASIEMEGLALVSPVRSPD